MKMLVLALALGQTPTEDYIRTVAPHVRPKEAVRLGKLIDKVAEKYELDPVLVAAIVKVESDFRGGQKACSVVKRKKACWVTCDRGLAQVNELWIKKWGLDPIRLRTDDAYNLATMARILAFYKRYYGHEPDWFLRYHSGTPRHKERYNSKLEPLLALSGNL